MKQFWGTGRRKTSVASVRITPGKGEFVINDKDVDQFIDLQSNKEKILKPLVVTALNGQYNIVANVKGGGLTGQTGAIQLGLARAIIEMDPELKQQLKDADLLTRDSRMVERKKYGRKKARKKFQFSKR
ncbi:MAG: 30S ribosomal protein S9 [Ignavibacteriae bacterium HGW-Ignavibacteriae-4]|jgi:small subunit ribosomal protein S9|nr:MAG: 30S ribosomal protein S9 [Ignavibacteriae bacterium HGW-Ignavibacteriae-4]